MRSRFWIPAALLLIIPGLAHAWWNDAWAYRKKITLNTSASGANTKEAVTDAPVLVRLHTGNFVFLDAKEGGADIRFVAGDDKSPLHYHIEQWDAANELALIWVRVPRISAAAPAEAIWLYFGNKDAQPEDDPKQRYDVNTALVLHFAAASAKSVDASTYAHPIAESTATPLAQGAPIDGAASFNSSARVRVAASPALKLGANGMTMSAWVRIPAAQAQAASIYSQQDGGNAVSLGLAGSRPVLRAGGAQVAAGADLAPNTWNHVAAVVGNGKAALFVNGQPAGEAAATMPELGGDAIVGAGLQGDLDEVQVSNIARSADWIRLAFAGQGPDVKLVGYGEDEAASSGGGHSYFKILLGAVTVDGWVVIVILLVMMVISFAVMIGKGLFVARTDKANQLFLDAFQKDPDGMLDPVRVEGAPKQLSGSSLFRLWRIGLRELKQRFDHYDQTGQPRVISAQTLGAIKASLDAGMVRESTRLNSQMVLLTIAISGGPFLGLLGTVVGVMITFAAIAAVGDVNVNSIAPGIAAALVATVAGLGVAIPALFGYNYLASRIKTVSNEMTVFADELVTRMAEKYAP
jgi:biopolymer transport protein ExbB